MSNTTFLKYVMHENVFYSYSKTNEQLEVFNKRFIRTPDYYYYFFLSFVLSILQKQTLDVAKQDMTTSTEGE